MSNTDLAQARLPDTNQLAISPLPMKINPKMSLPKLKRNYSKKDMQTLMEQAKEASELLKALSHETRLMILCLLSEGEMSVSEIEDIVDLPQATVSQQLARLRFSGLVTTRREGRTIHYQLAEGEVRVVIESLYKLFCSNTGNS